ncbi:hypothetical protein G6Z94_11625 [Vibrio aestuarianus]|uniref:hypothetical protein n=1 Tax=Vibrio aestuarianus TaxID=28171 RepID=UPI0015935504|nr:hypothetical protein [Vibrio aestuarianus]NGZ17988.1 hypothetical protein [Vibrio aestuarianus]
MYTEQQREVMRDDLMAAFADYTKTTVGAYNNTGVINTSGYAVLANAMNAQQSRPRGTSKENCHQEVFKHLRILRALKALPSHSQKWLKYNYSEKNSPQLAHDMIELTLGDLDFLSGRPQKKRRLKELVTTWVLCRCQFRELLQKDIIEALSISRTAFVKTYSGPSNKVGEHLKALDNQALDEILEALGVKKVNYT